MTDTQMLILALPSVVSIVVVLVGILLNNSRLSDLRSHMDRRFDDIARHVAWRTAASRRSP